MAGSILKIYIYKVCLKANTKLQIWADSIYVAGEVKIVPNLKLNRE